MVYPFDLVTGAELVDKSITENGFKLDMAKSRYLTIDVKRSTLTKVSGTYNEDIRFSESAKDGEEYVDEGIYEFTVKNLYTNNEPTTKIIYVGSSPAIKALSVNNITVQELNEQLKLGAELNDDGTLVVPAAEEAESDMKDTVEESVESETKQVEETAGAEQEMPKNIQSDASSMHTIINDKPIYIVVLVVVLTAVIILASIRMRSKKHKKNE